MTYRDRVNAAVQAIGAGLGSPPSLDAHGMLTMEFGKGRRCMLVASDAEHSVTLHAALAGVHGDAGTALLEAALRENFVSARTDRGIVGYDEDRRELVLTTWIGGEVDAAGLAAALDAFISKALAVSGRLDEAARANRSAPADTPDDAGPSTFAIRL